MWLGDRRRSIDLEERYQILPPLSPEEYAAIMELDGVLGRDDAEMQAFLVMADL
jgi:hypothetical protein